MRNAGIAAEQLAASFLKQQGLVLIAQNYHCRFGEIDLIMRDGNTLVFIEVRLRGHSGFGGAAESITFSKQRKLIITANHYLQQHGNQPCRFDAILMSKADYAHIEWIQHAFDA
jgi:putative endonuclease